MVMGLMASWVAVQGAPKAELLAALKLAETGEAVRPGEMREGFCLGKRSDGWLIVFSHDFDWGDPARVVELSRFGLAVGLQFEDKVEMTATAAAARDGVETWRVHHHNDPIWRLDVTGAPPPALAEIRAHAFQEQEEEGGEEADVDFIHEIPLEIAKTACGFRADDELDMEFFRLEPEGRATGALTDGRPQRRGFLARLFSRG
jgi:hypothetical protein